MRVRVIPNSRKTEFSGYRDAEVLLRLNAPALEGKANNTAIRYIAEYLGLPRSGVCLAAGERSRHKVFEIIGLELKDVESKLGASGR